MSVIKFTNPSLKIWEPINFSPKRSKYSLVKLIKSTNKKVSFFKNAVFSVNAIANILETPENKGIFFSHVAISGNENKEKFYSAGIAVGLHGKKFHFPSTEKDLHISLQYNINFEEPIHNVPIVLNTDKKLTFTDYPSLEKLTKTETPKIRQIIKDRIGKEEEEIPIRPFVGVFFDKEFLDTLVKYCNNNAYANIILFPISTKYNKKVNKDKKKGAVSFVIAVLKGREVVPIMIKNNKGKDYLAYVLSGYSYPRGWRDFGYKENTIIKINPDLIK